MKILGNQVDGLHPAVLRMINMSVRAAAGKWIGGIAGDPVGALILTGLGVTELSMSIPSIAAVKATTIVVAKKHSISGCLRRAPLIEYGTSTRRNW